MLAAVAAAILASAVGCSTPASSGPSSAGSQSAASSAAQQQVRAEVQQLLQRPTSIGVTGSPGPVPKGKLIAYVACGAPTCLQISSYAAAAAKALGWNYRFINAGSGTDLAQVKEAYDEAIRIHANAVLGSGFPRSIYNSEIAQLKAANVPVIEWATTDQPGNGLTAVMDGTAASAEYGKEMADFILSRNPWTSATSTLYVTISVYPTDGIIGTGLQQELRAKCPACKYAELDVPASSIGEDLPSRVVAYLQAHPSVNNLAFAFNDITLGVPAALRAAGLAGRINTSVVKDTDPTVDSYIASGGLTAEISDPWQINVWRSFDLLIRLWNGKPITPDTDAATLPQWIVTKANLPSATTNFPPVANYETQFEKLW